MLRLVISKQKKKGTYPNFFFSIFISVCQFITIHCSMGSFQSNGPNQKLQKADFGFTFACKINWRSFTLHVFETISCTSELLKCTIVTLLLLRILKRVVTTDFFNAIILPYYTIYIVNFSKSTLNIFIF